MHLTPLTVYSSVLVSVRSESLEEYKAGVSDGFRRPRAHSSIEKYTPRVVASRALEENHDISFNSGLSELKKKIIAIRERRSDGGGGIGGCGGDNCHCRAVCSFCEQFSRHFPFKPRPCIHRFSHLATTSWPFSTTCAIDSVSSCSSANNVQCSASRCLAEWSDVTLDPDYLYTSRCDLLPRRLTTFLQGLT